MDRFGERALPGGDLYASETAFFDLISRRPEDYAARWLVPLELPVLHVDGTRPVPENILRITFFLQAHSII